MIMCDLCEKLLYSGSFYFLIFLLNGSTHSVLLISGLISVIVYLLSATFRCIIGERYSI